MSAPLDPRELGIRGGYRGVIRILAERAGGDPGVSVRSLHNWRTTRQAVHDAILLGCSPKLSECGEPVILAALSGMRSGPVQDAGQLDWCDEEGGEG